jgi:hypothetical protein
MFGFRSRKAVPSLVSKPWYYRAMPFRTEHMTVLGEEGCVGAEVDTAADHVKSAEFGAIILA